jgi:hypothetical protein
LRESVAELSEKNMQLEAENAQLKAHIANVEASKELTAASSDTVLLWVAHDYGVSGYRRFQSPTIGGVYDVIPCFGEEAQEQVSVYWA